MSDDDMPSGPLAVHLPGNETARLDRAREMLDNGSTGNEIYNATGLVVMANGDIRNVFGGKVIGRYERDVLEHYLNDAYTEDDLLAWLDARKVFW